MPPQPRPSSPTRGGGGNREHAITDRDKKSEKIYFEELDRDDEDNRFLVVPKGGKFRGIDEAKLRDEHGSRVIITRIMVSAVTAIRILSAILSFVGATSLASESEMIQKLGVVSASDQGSKEEGVTGWRLIAFAFGFNAFELLVECWFSINTRRKFGWFSTELMTYAWPEARNEDLLRQMIFFLGDLMTFLGAAMILSEYPTHATNDDRYDETQDEFYKTRLIGGGPTTLFFIGTIIRGPIAIVIQFLAGEGFNVCYLFCFGRCGTEWENTTRKKVTLQDGKTEKFIIPTFMIMRYTGCCIETVDDAAIEPEKYNKCDCLATFWHNWFGAIRMWIYLSSFLFFLGGLNEWYSGADVFEHTVWPAYVQHNATLVSPPTSSSTAAHNASFEAAAAGFFPPDSHLRNGESVTKDNDTGHYMNAAATLFAAAEFLRIVAAIAYWIGIVRNESSIPASHQVRQPLYQCLCP